MKLSKSKLALAKVINENGGWVDDANFSSQDYDGWVYHFRTKPTIDSGSEVWNHRGCIGKGHFKVGKINNWHQTCLSREEYYQVYPELTKQDAIGLYEAINLIDGGDNPNVDADGWIEWSGGECPAGEDELVDYKLLGGSVVTNGWFAGGLQWPHEFSTANIIAYRLHKPDVNPEFCESVMRSITEPEAKPTIEQLAQDYRNKLDFANRKQNEADESRAVADAALGELELAGKEIGFMISPIIFGSNQGINITNICDLELGDLIKVTGFDGDVLERNRCDELLNSDSCTVVSVLPVKIEVSSKAKGCNSGWMVDGAVKTKWKFIGRP